MRAAAAACLGRLGRPEAAEPLVKRLGDPSKIVWRSAAWALRRLGNQGVGVDAILAAPCTIPIRGSAGVRRGSSPTSSTGMDTRLDLADRLIELTARPRPVDQAPGPSVPAAVVLPHRRSALQRRIIETYLARMAEPELPVVRKNLSEGLYIMLDENLGGGVSLQKNIAELPEPTAAE